jgi:hypothetical protein
MLFHGTRANTEMARNFLVAASLNEQLQNLLVSRGDFDIVQIDHGLSSVSFRFNSCGRDPRYLLSKPFAKYSLLGNARPFIELPRIFVFYSPVISFHLVRRSELALHYGNVSPNGIPPFPS